jgi:hypothetical protein
MLSYLWRTSKGYRLRPWASPYIRWRMETYWGTHAEDIGFGEFWRYLWIHRKDFIRFLHWADRMAKG